MSEIGMAAAAVVLNALVGAGVWAYLDDEERRLFKWYQSAPGAFIQILTLEAWPLGLYFYWHFRDKPKVTE